MTNSIIPGTEPEPTPFKKIFVICFSLAAMTLIVYGRTLHYEFVDYDDGPFVYENPIVAAGWTLKGIAWAFDHDCVSNWVPLTMVSHMMDCQFFGLDAGGHHLTNVLLHTTSAIILFLVLRQMTGAVWRSAFVAAVFAIHPLHVESVAWVAERKDVLSGFFFMLTLWAYVHYTRQPDSLPRYFLVLSLFALGLMSKSMLVTMPLILLLLDFWPLNRFSKQSSATEPNPPVRWLKNLSIPARLIVEKIPMLLLSLVCCLLTVLAERHDIIPLTKYPLSLRTGNALVSCVLYIYQMFHPANLAPFYPFPSSVPLWESTAAFILLLAVSLAVVSARRTRPYLLAGWLWYLIMIFPVIGIVQVGHPAHADRYTYLPQIGLYVLMTWFAVESGAWLRHYRIILGGGAILVLVAFMVNAGTQAAYWRNSESLWIHTLACTQNNQIAHNNLAYVLAEKGDLDDATLHFQKAIEIDPDYEDAYNNLGNLCFEKGQWDHALAYYQKAAQLKPDNAEVETNLGLVYVRKGQLDEAIAHFRKAVAIDPNYPDAAKALHLALSQKEHAGSSD